MRECYVKVPPLRHQDAARISSGLRSVDGVTAVEVDVSTGWIAIRGLRLREAELLAAVHACGFVPEQILPAAPIDS